MNATRSKEGMEVSRDVRFLGKAGVVEIKGLRVAYLSGIDSDLLGESIYNDKTNKYKSNYLGREDIDKVLSDYQRLIESSGKPGVDVLLCG